MDHQVGGDYQSIFENASEGRFQASLDGRLLKVNPAMARVYGYDSPEEMLTSVNNIGKQIYVDAEERESFLNELLVDGHIEKFECQNYRKDGSIFWAQMTARVIQKIEEDIYIEGLVTNITTHKEAEFALQTSEQKYRALVEHLPAVIFLDDTNDAQTTLYISPKIQELLGYTPEEWIADPFIWENSIHPNDKDRVLAKDKLTNETGESFSLEYRLRGKDGTYRWIREESALILDSEGNPLFWQGFLLDISAQKHAESTISQNGEQFKRIFQGNPIASLIATLEEGRFIAANDAYWKLSGYKPNEFLGRTSVELGFISKDKRNELVTKLKNEQTIRNASGKLITKNGEIRDTLEFYELISFDEQDCILSMFYDVTEQVKAQLELQENEERYRQLYESESDAIFLIDNECGQILEVNEAATTLYGYSKEELLNKKNSDLSAEAEETSKVTRNTPINKNQVISIPLRFHRKKDGTIFPVEITGRFFTWRGRPVHLAAIRDITERKRAEDTYKRQLEDLTILHNIAVAASSSNSLDELIERTTNSIFDTLHPDNCGVELVIDRGETYQAHPSYRGAPISEIRKAYPVSKGITGKVISTGVPIRLGNVSEDPAFFEAMQDIRSELCVPISIQNRIIGAINIESKKADAYDESDERLLNTIAGTLGTAIERLRLFETSQRRLKELTILNKVTLSSSDATSVDDLIDKITQIIGESLYPDNFGVLLLNEISTALLPHSSYRGITNGKFAPEIPLPHGVSGQVAASGKSLRIANVRNHKNYIEVTSQVRSELCVPISHGERVLGVINAESLRINAFTEDDEQLLATIASTLATAIEKLRLLEAEKKRRQETETLLDATTTLTTSLNLDTLLDTILETLSRIVPYDSASIALEKDGSLLIAAGRGFPPGYSIIGRDLGYSKEWLHLNTTHKPFIVPDAQIDPTFEKWEGSGYIRGWMGVPMVVHGKLKGFINFDSRKPNAFNDHDAIIAQTFANSAAVAIENARLFEVEQQSRQKADALREATAHLTASIELEALYGTILDSLAKLLPFEGAWIEILDQGVVKVVAGKRLSENTNGKGQQYSYDATKWGNLDALREPIIINDVQEDERFVKYQQTESIRSWMGVPMFVQDNLVGFLNFDSPTKGFFTKDHAALAQTFGNHAAVAIEKARLFQEESQRSQIIEAMAEIANEFASAQEILPALDKITQLTCELLHASTVAIYLLQDDNKTIKVVTALGAYREQLMSHTIQIGTGITGNIIATGKAEIVDDMLKDFRRIRVPGTPEDDSQRDTIMSAPLILRGKTIGAINAWRRRSSGLFNESELNFLVSIANQTSISMESIRLFQETARRAKEAHAIAEVGRDISSTLQLDTVLERIAQYAKDLLRAETSAVYLSNPEEPLLRAIIAIGNDAKEIMEFPLLVGSGILGNIALQKSGEIVNDILGDRRAITVKGTEVNPDEHLMGVPVLSKDNLTGLLAVWRTGRDEEFKLYELDFLSSLAQQAAVAIENARLFEVEQRHFQEAEILRQAAESITSTLDIQQVLSSILDNLNRVVPFDSAGVFLIENDQVRLTACRGIAENVQSTGQLFPANNTLFLEIWQTGQPLILKDAQNDSRYEGWVVNHVRGWMGIPLIARGTIIGYITIDSRKTEAYKERDATLAMTFAHQAAVAIENARLYERGEQQIRQLTVLRDIDSAISSSFDLRITLNLLIGYASRELDVDAVAILLYNPDLKSLYLYTDTGFNNKQNNTMFHIRIGEGLAGHVVLQRKLVHIEKLGETTELRPPLYTTGEEFKSYFGIPLISKGQIKGVMEIYTRKERNPEPEWLNFLQTLAGQAAIAIDNVQLFRNLQRSNQELILAYDTTLAGWGRALELRDKETQGHTDRVVELTLELARLMGIEGEELTHIMRGTLLHDIGKMGIPDHILHKPGPLTEEEWAIMRQHPQYAFDLMNPIPYLRPALEIPYGHHERWDGSGYPHGLKGEEIPLAARIFAVVDIWDALLYKRVYRDAWPEEKVIEYLKSTAGIELDPAIVEKFLELIEAKRYEDQAE